MTRHSPRHGARRKRNQNKLLEKGVSATFIGLALLTMPVFLGGSPVITAIATGLRIPGWMALGVGLVLIGMHFAVKRKVESDNAPPPRVEPLRQGAASAALRPTNPASSSPRSGVQAVPQGVEKEGAPALQDAADGPNATALAALPTTWSPAVFAAIEWRRFEAVCEALFAQAGFTTRSQSHGADGGVDIWLHSANSTREGGLAAIAQCKHWQGKQVGVKEVREFFGVMASHGLQRGTYATSSTYTTDAQAFARANQIHTLDGVGLLRLIATRTPAQQQVLLNVAFEGEYWRPTCASCGTKMVERTSSKAKNIKKFWGCPNYPHCRATLQIANEVLNKSVPLC